MVASKLMHPKKMSRHIAEAACGGKKHWSGDKEEVDDDDWVVVEICIIKSYVSI
jgi:hypothetical protein